MSKKLISTLYKKFLEEKHEDFTLIPENDSLYLFTGTMKGPKDTPYENGTFHFIMELKSSFPFIPSEFKFTTPIYHPIISSSGSIDYSILTKEWSHFFLVKFCCSPTYMRFMNFLFAIQCFLGDFELQEGCLDIKSSWFENLEESKKIARSWTYLYAT